MTTGNKALLVTILFLMLATVAAISGTAQAPTTARADDYFFGPWEEEPNDESSQANGPLLSHRWYRGHPDKEDYFSIQLDKGGEITIDLFGHSGESEEAVQVLLKDDSGNSNFLTRVWRPPYHIEYFGEKGLYFVQIHTDITKDYDPSIPYRLRATFPMTHRSLLPTIVTNLPPNRPSDPSPAHGSKGVSRSVELTWTGGDPDGNSVSYDVYLVSGNEPPDLLKCENVSIEKCNPGFLGLDTRYYWKVVSEDELGAVTPGPVWYFETVRNSTPNIPSNPSPANNSVGVRPSVELTWTGGDPDEGDGDSVRYDVFLERGDTSPDLLECENVSSEKCIPSEALEYGGFYAWKVISTDSHGAFAEGPVWHFRVEMVLPP